MLKMIVESIDGLSEAEAAHYVKKGERYELQVEGAKTQGDLDRVQKALNDERNLTKDLKAQVAAWGDLKPEDVKTQLAKIPELETLAEAGGKKLDDKQVEALVNARLAPFKTENEKLRSERDEAKAKNVEYAAKELKQTIHGEMRKLGAESKALPETFAGPLGAMMLLADAVCTVDAAGQVVIREGANIPEVEHGTLLKDALPSLQKTYPYLWPGSNGGSAPGSGNGPGNQPNVFKENNLTARAKLLQENPAEAERQFKASGLSDYFADYVKK